MAYGNSLCTGSVSQELKNTVCSLCVGLEAGRLGCMFRCYVSLTFSHYEYS